MNSTPSDRRWLVVDDDADLAGLIAESLRDLRMAEVEAFTSPGQALMDVKNVPSLDVMITDRDMPGFDGLELSRRVSEQNPAVKIILVSAHLEDLRAEDLRRHGISAILPKPFSISRLTSLVQAVTGETASTRKSSTGGFAQRAA